MNMLKLIKSVAICLMLVLSFSSKSQISYDGVVKGLHTYVNNDSLKGFDENLHKQIAFQGGFFGREYNVYMYNAKKSFLAQKYPTKIVNSGSGSKPPSGNTINSAPCVNEDFEVSPSVPFTTIPQGGPSSTIVSGWSISQGQNGFSSGSIYYNTCSVSAMPNNSFSYTPSETWIRQTPISDPNFPGGVPNSPLGGTKVLQLNDNLALSGQISRASQTFPVTSTNALFQFAYAACFNGTGHLCCDQPFLNIKVKDCLGNVLACPQITVIASGPSCVNGNPGFATNTFGYLYKNWTVQSIDLTPYIGSCVTIEVAVGDCTGWAHFGYCYFDAICKPMTLQVNSNFFPAGSSAIVAAGCGTNTAVMTAPAGLGPYLWNGPGGSGINNNTNQTVTTTMAGNYTLVMNPVGSCAPITKTISLTFGSNPTSGFTTANVCNSYTFTNTGTGAPAVQTYSFIGTGAPSSYTTTSPTSSVVFSNPGTYTMHQVVTNTAGCTSTQTTVLTIPNGPTLSVNNYSMCPGTSVGLGVSGANTYVWSGPNLSNPNIPNPTASPLSTSVYTVSGTNAIGCVSTQTLQVTVNSSPTITVNSPSMCAGSSSVVTANGALSYIWNPPFGLSSVNISNPTASPLVTTVYTVTGSDINGCKSTQTSTVTVNQLPIISIVSATTCPSIPAIVSASGANTYSWSNGATTYSITDSPFTNTTYTVVGTSVAGCSSSAVASITIKAPFTVTLSTNSPVCQGGTLTLSAPLSGYVYSWVGPNGFTSTLSDPRIENAQPNNSGVYSATLTDSYGCIGNASINAVVNPNPIVSITSTNGNICAPGCVTFTCNSTNSVNNIDWFFTNGGATSNSITTQCFNKGGVYTSTATVYDNNGCAGSTTYSIEIYQTPTADFIFAPLRPIETEDINFTDASFGANITQWYWFFNSQSLNSTLQNPQTVYEIGTYPVTLIVKSDKGCSDTITKIIVVGEDYGIYVPNTFTPNGDGLNDIFQPKGFGIVKYQLEIFDRWGERIFETKTFEQGWDGKVHRGIDYGVICKNDVYVWKISLTNVFGKSHELKGHVTLIK